MKIALDIWIFTDCANAITRLEKFEFRTHLMEKLHRNCKELYEINYKIHIHWISRHAKISKTLQADEQAKKKLKKIENQNNFMLFQYLSKRIKSDKVEKWNSMWQNNTKKSKYYQLHNSNLQQTFFKKSSNREKLIFLTFLQIKIELDFFKFYLYRLSAYKSNQYNENCNEIQTFEYLHLNCHHFSNERKEMKKNMKTSVTIRTLFNTIENIKNVSNFIKNIRICTKKWILNTVKNEKMHEKEWENLE